MLRLRIPEVDSDILGDEMVEPQKMLEDVLNNEIMLKSMPLELRFNICIKDDMWLTELNPDLYENVVVDFKSNGMGQWDYKLYNHDMKEVVQHIYCDGNMIETEFGVWDVGYLKWHPDQYPGKYDKLFIMFNAEIRLFDAFIQQNIFPLTTIAHDSNDEKYMCLEIEKGVRFNSIGINDQDKSQNVIRIGFGDPSNRKYKSTNFSIGSRIVPEWLKNRSGSPNNNEQSCDSIYSIDNKHKGVLKRHISNADNIIQAWDGARNLGSCYIQTVYKMSIDYNKLFSDGFIEEAFSSELMIVHSRIGKENVRKTDFKPICLSSQKNTFKLPDMVPGNVIEQILESVPSVVGVER